MSRLLVLGGGYLQSGFIATAVELGHEVTFLDRNIFCDARKVHGAIFQHIDISDENKVFEFSKKFNPDAIIPPANELGNKVAASICQKLGLLYNSVDIVYNTLDKSGMRKVLQGATINAPKSSRYDGDVEKLIEDLSFPLIIKPSNSSASRGVSSVSNRAELAKAIQYAQINLNPGGTILAEELVIGQQFSIETVTTGTSHYIAGITKEEMSDPPKFIERSDFMGPEIFQEYINLFLPFIDNLLTLLGVEVGPCHIEVLVENNQVFLIEVASRSGGWRDHMMKYAGAPNYNELIIKSYLRQSINAKEFFAPKINVVAGVLMCPDDLKVYLKAKKDGRLVGEYFSGGGPSVDPRSLIDSFGYFYAEGDYNEINKYSLRSIRI